MSEQDDRQYMGTAEEAYAALVAAAKAWREYRKPLIATRAEHKKQDALERDARFSLANAALLWLWHEERLLSEAKGSAEG